MKSPYFKAIPTAFLYLVVFFLTVFGPIFVFGLAFLIIKYFAVDRVFTLTIASLLVLFGVYLVSFKDKVAEIVKEKLINEKTEEIGNAIKGKEKELEVIDKLLLEKQQSYPWLAQQFADYHHLIDEDLVKKLKNKSHPALVASEKVKEIAKEKRELIKTNKMLEYQIHYYENIFPWLEEFKLIDPNEAWSLVKGMNYDENDEYQNLKSWLSPAEYNQLPSEKKYQLALDRYLTREKNNWEVGRDYERYIGYLYELEGFTVEYIGALKGFEDMGRDLIVYKNDDIFIIQCKRWKVEKVIHEKHIFQLFGSVVHYKLEQPKSKAIGLFITTCKMSELAKSCAEYLGIQIRESCLFREYPLIKCNISKRTGEKIYHLPFDQQYDKVVIDKKRNECYVKTIKEAESNGFRRAWRWHPDDN